MTTVDEILEALSRAARENRKADFDDLERALLARFDGSLEGMPDDLYQRYLEVDRHWPVVPASSDDAPVSEQEARRTLSVRLPAELDMWVRDLAARVDRSPSAVLAECIRIVSDDEQESADLERRLRRSESPGD